MVHHLYRVQYKFLGYHNTKHACQCVRRTSQADGLCYCRVICPREMIELEGLEPADTSLWEDWQAYDAVTILIETAVDLDEIGPLPPRGALGMVYLQDDKRTGN